MIENDCHIQLLKVINGYLSTGLRPKAIKLNAFEALSLSTAMGVNIFDDIQDPKMFFTFAGVRLLPKRDFWKTGGA